MWKIIILEWGTTNLPFSIMNHNHYEKWVHLHTKKSSLRNVEMGPFTH